MSRGPLDVSPGPEPINVTCAPSIPLSAKPCCRQGSLICYIRYQAAMACLVAAASQTSIGINHQSRNSHERSTAVVLSAILGCHHQHFNSANLMFFSFSSTLRQKDQTYKPAAKVPAEGPPSLSQLQWNSASSVSGRPRRDY
jgi:hypothetical protein